MKNSARVAYFLENFPVYSETFIVREIIELKRNGHEIQVFSLNNTAGRPVYSEVVHSDAKGLEGEVRFCADLYGRVSRFKKLLLHIRFAVLNPLGYMRALTFSFSAGKDMMWHFKNSVICAAEMRAEEIDHIHVHFARDACKLAMIASMVSGIPYSFTVHTNFDIVSQFSTDYMEEKYRNAKFVVCISEYNKHFVLDRIPAMRPERIRVVHCGIDPESLQKTEKPAGGYFTMAAVGRLVETKGFKYLVEACGFVKKRFDFPFLCRIIGDGRERQELIDLIDKLDLGIEVRLLGAMEQASVLKTLKSSDLFVLPCVVASSGRRDGIPVALMEAMALGLPVVSTTVSGIPELVKDGSGILVDPGDPESLASAIGIIAAYDRTKRESMGGRGRSIVEREFNLVAETRKLSELFQG